MAEFVEAMQQAKRLCAAHGGMCISHNCPMDNGEDCRLAADQDDVDYNEVERIIMAWAAEHPEPRYPTWREWYDAAFSDGSIFRRFCPSIFGDDYRDCGTVGACDKCQDRPIPADIAAKLGIRPIEEEQK